MNPMRFASFAAVIMLLGTPGAFAAGARTHYIIITVVHADKPATNAAVTITDNSATPPEHTIMYTRSDGTVKFPLWPNAEGQICFRAQLRSAPFSKSHPECFESHYPASVHLTI